jgi:hypothetical protein
MGFNLELPCAAESRRSDIDTTRGTLLAGGNSKGE